MLWLYKIVAPLGIDAKFWLFKLFDWLEIISPERLLVQCRDLISFKNPG